MTRTSFNLVAVIVGNVILSLVPWKGLTLTLSLVRYLIRTVHTSLPQLTNSKYLYLITVYGLDVYKLKQQMVNRRTLYLTKVTRKNILARHMAFEESSFFK